MYLYQLKHLVAILGFLILALGNCFAESFLYFQNNSSLSFAVSTSQTGPHNMDSDEWWGMSSGTINPWQLETNLLWTNRNVGIHNGTDFFLTATLTSGGQSIDLKLRLNGNFVGSDLWQSSAGPGFSHSWYSDRNFHQETFTLNGKTVTLKYTAYAAGTYDDILFVLQEHDPFPVLASDLTDPAILNVLSYNIFMLTPPISLSDQGTRAEYIHQHVSGYDVIIINEAFDNAARATLTTNLSAEYPYYTAVVDEALSFEDGGVLIYSRWPIELSNHIVYDDCDGDDCLAAKGAMYARINKLGKKYHVFGTHTQAWPDAANVATRQAQMTQMKNFADSYAIPSNEAVIYGGDFNVEKIANYLNEYDDMFTILNTEEPNYLGHGFTYDYLVSDYADSPYQEYLDYVMYEKAHLIPTIQTNEVIILRSIADAMWDIFDLSDHLAVHGRFQFPLNLPITLTDFSGKTINQGHQITWRTASETQNDYFELEHAIDGRNFQKIAQIEGAGNTPFTQNYTYLHTTPNLGNNYYRLKQVDLDGSIHFSKVMVLTYQSKTSLSTSIYPNPVADQLFVKINDGIPSDFSLKLFNAAGQLLLEKEIQQSIETDIDIKAWPIGLYYLEIRTPQETTSHRFYKGQ